MGHELQIGKHLHNLLGRTTVGQQDYNIIGYTIMRLTFVSTNQQHLYLWQEIEII